MWYQLVVLCFGPASYGDTYPATCTMGHLYRSGFLPILDAERWIPSLALSFTAGKCRCGTAGLDKIAQSKRVNQLPYLYSLNVTCRQKWHHRESRILCAILGFLARSTVPLFVLSRESSSFTASFSLGRHN